MNCYLFFGVFRSRCCRSDLRATGGHLLADLASKLRMLELDTILAVRLASLSLLGVLCVLMSLVSTFIYRVAI